jgi:signal transduction histidine kinase
MDIAVREVDRLNRLITELLDYARPRSEERRAQDLGEQVAEIVRAFEQERREKITVAATLLAGVMVEAATGQLRQVLWNLIRNAADAMPGGGEIAIQLATDGRRAALAIRDQGPGIPRDRLDRIFEPFYSTKTGGTGLGLATVARIVADHGGAIDVASEPGQGATFTVRLPLAP